jgi:hypothetical protein
MKTFVMLLMLMPLGIGTMPMDKMMMMDNACPMALGSEIAVADTPDGIALTFTTKPANVAELQRRIEMWAAMRSFDRPTPPMMQGYSMPATVKYEAIENCARLTLTPHYPVKLSEFRARVQARVEEMKKGECAMMRDMMQGMMKGMMKGMMDRDMMKGMDKSDKSDDHSGHHPEEK